MFSGFESVGVIFLIFAAGFLFQIKKLWPDKTPDALSTIVVRLAAPCLAITSIVSGFDRAMLKESVFLLLIAALHILILFALSKWTSRAFGLKDGRKTIYEVTFTFSNVIFIGLPINQIVFGGAGVSFLFSYYILSLACFWSFGSAQIAAAGARKIAAGSGEKISGRSAISIGKILNPGFIGVTIGYVLVMIGVGLPSVLDKALSYVADLTVPLSLLVIGANLTIFAKGIPRVTRDEIFIMIGKFIISPLLMFGLLKIFGITGMPFYVFLLSSTMPCHMQTSILAQHYDVEPAYASKLVGLSTLISFITIPAYVALIYQMMG